MMGNNSMLDLANIDAKFGQIMSICSQDIEPELISDPFKFISDPFKFWQVTIPSQIKSMLMCIQNLSDSVNLFSRY